MKRRADLCSLGFPGGSDGKESSCNVGDLGLIPGLGRRPGEGNGNPLPVFLPGEFHGQGSLMGYSSWGHKESDTAEPLTLSRFMCNRQLVGSCCITWGARLGAL